MPVAQRRAKAARAIAKMSKGAGSTEPVNIEGRVIAKTFWGKAWCDHLESYSDFENRLPRGRTYVRNGSVMDLRITEGKVAALVSGSDLYKIVIQIKPLAKSTWSHVQSECAGKIDSLMEMLQGRISSSVMGVVTDRKKGLFPAPSEIQMKCSCPDWAEMCKHIAAALYGVGSRLDEKPELLFLMRGVDPAELISEAAATHAVAQTPPTDGHAVIGESELSDVFGIEIESSISGTVPKAAKKPGRSKAETAAGTKAGVKTKPKAKEGTKVGKPPAKKTQARPRTKSVRRPKRD